MKLDVGCGSNPNGDVNCDLFISDVGHRCQEDSPSFDAKRIKNFVLCDITRLPFNENAFDEVYSNHAIEHLSNPCKCLDEMVRVSNDKVLVYVPHRFGDRMLWWQTNPYHISFFNKKWFFKYLQKRKHLFGMVKYTNYKVWLFILTIPQEIELTIRKLKKNP